MNEQNQPAAAGPIEREAMKTETPLPCPCCGSDDVAHSIHDWGDFVMCNTCGLRACSTDSLPEGTPLEVWNKRRCVPEVDELAQHIRWLNGSNKMGAGALAEKLVDWLQSLRKRGIIEFFEKTHWKINESYQCR